MRVRLLYVFLFFGANQFCHGQVALYKFPAQIDSLIVNDSIAIENGLYQKVAVEYSRIGAYKKVLAATAKDWTGSPAQKLDKQCQDDFLRYSSAPAIKCILDRAKNTRIVVVNEAHHVPLCRVFMESLLPGLREEGFDMLGMETFDKNDSTISERGYPILNSGVYSVEPCYGNMIRKAISLKYDLFGYETTNGRGGQREADQADNIVALIKQHPDSKFIIYCGYAHLIEDTIPKPGWGLAMAARVKKITGIDPLTINQVTLTEVGADSFDSPYRNLIHKDQSLVMIDDQGNSLFVPKTIPADVFVYHPDTKYVHGRPTWQITDDKRTENINNKITISFPCLAFVYRAGEDYNKAVPTDVIEIGTQKEDVDIILEKDHKNVIILRNPQGQKQVINE